MRCEENETNRKIKIGIKTKFVLILALLMILLCVGIGTTTYSVSYNRVISSYSQSASNAAKMAASLIDGDKVEGWLKNGADADYTATQKKLQDLKRNFGIKFLYASLPVENVNDTIYLFDIALEGEDTTQIGKLGQRSGEVDVYNQVMQVYKTGKGVKSGIVTESEFGYLISAYEPLIRHSDNKVIGWTGVDMQMSDVLADVKTQTIQILSLTIVIILIFAFIIIFVMNRQIINPVKRLSAHMNNFTDGATLADARLTDIHTHDEIETAADSFNRMADDIVAYTQNLERVTADKERISTELEVARQIQSSMLPCTFPAFPENRQFEVYATMHPAKEVGGDFYDFFFVDEKHLCVVIADVSGKGIPAALYMVITRTLIKNQAQLGKTPEEIFTSVNNMLCENNSLSMFVTAFLGLLDIETGHFIMTNAGHNPPLIKNNGGVYEWIKIKSGLFLAGMENFKYRQFELVLEKGDVIYLYTDGVTEALNLKEELYGNDRLLETLNKDTGMGPVELLEAVRADIDVFSEGAAQADDITMLALRFYGPEGGSKPAPEITVDADTEKLQDVLEFVEGILEMAECPMKVQTAISIAVEEIFVNVASYAYGENKGSCTVKMEILPEPKRAVITFADSGIPYDPLLKADPDVAASAEDRGIGGLGIFMVKKSMDSVHYAYKNGMNVLTIEKNL